MSSVYEAKAAKAAFPEGAADATGIRGVMAVAFTTTASSTQLPRDMGGKRVYFRTTADVQTNVTTGTAGQTLTLNATSAPLTGNAARGWTVLAGGILEGILPVAPAGQNLYLNLIGVSGSGTVELFCRELVAP